MRLKAAPPDVISSLEWRKIPNKGLNKRSTFFVRRVILNNNKNAHIQKRKKNRYKETSKV